jgi:ABC-type polysaccharide/polyol phosphate export permease
MRLVAPGRATTWDHINVLVARQFRLRSKRAVLGIAWPIIAPLFLLLLYAVVFQNVFRVPVAHYGVFLMTGLLPWSFLAQTLGQSVTSIANEADLIRRTRFRAELLPIAVTIVMAAYFIVTLLGFVAWLGVTGQLDAALLPALVFPIGSLVLFVAGTAVALALLDVYNRDLRWVLGNLLTVWFFLVPVVYRPGMAHGWLRSLRSVDPMNMVIGEFREILYRGSIAYPSHVPVVAAVCAAWCGAALLTYRRFGRNLACEL